MTLKSYLWGIRILTLFSLASFGTVIFYIDPERAGFFGKSIFYIIFFFSCAGVFNLMLIFSRRKIMGGETALATIGLSFRQAVLLSLLASILLFMQSLRILVWWDGLMAAAGVFLIELYFLSRN